MFRVRRSKGVTLPNRKAKFGTSPPDDHSLWRTEIKRRFRVTLRKERKRKKEYVGETPGAL